MTPRYYSVILLLQIATMPPCPEIGGRKGPLSKVKSGVFVPQMKVIVCSSKRCQYSLLISTSRPYHSTVPIQYISYN
jgi:hypothetical protein